MTEETPKKKPRRKRRTKAQIEADKAAKLAAEAPKKEVKPAVDESWQKTDEVIVEMFEEAVTSDTPVKEDGAVNVEESARRASELTFDFQF